MSRFYIHEIKTEDLQKEHAVQQEGTTMINMLPDNRPSEYMGQKLETEGRKRRVYSNSWTLHYATGNSG